MAKILVIEDDDLAQFTVQRILEDGGHNVVVANNGAKGMTAFKSGDINRVVTDIIMPEKEGIETITDLRHCDPQVKIIAMSGGGRTGNLDFLWLAKKLGADRVLPKPFGPESLCALVDDCLAELGADGHAAG